MDGFAHLDQKFFAHETASGPKAAHNPTLIVSFFHLVAGAGTTTAGATTGAGSTTGAGTAAASAGHAGHTHSAAGGTSGHTCAAGSTAGTGSAGAGVTTASATATVASAAAGSVGLQPKMITERTEAIAIMFLMVSKLYCTF